MAVQFLNNVSLNNNELQNVKLQNLATEPAVAAGEAGKIIYRTGTNFNRPYWTDGSAYYGIFRSAISHTNNPLTNALRDADGKLFAAAFVGDLTGNADTATKLKTARAITITGNKVSATTSAAFDGSADVTIDITALSVAPGDITLGDGSFIVGNVSNKGAAVAKSSIPISGFGAAQSSVDMGNNKITNLAEPVNAKDAATKYYVDSTAVGLNVLQSVRVATAAALPASTYNGTAKTLTATANGALTVDGVTVTNNDRILVKNQADAKQNGIYFVVEPGTAISTWQLSRSEDFDSSAEADPGSYVFVTSGNTLSATGWVMSSAPPITLDTSLITWTQFSGVGGYSAGKGLVLSGSTFHFAKSENYTGNSVPFASGESGIAFTNGPTTGQFLVAGASAVPTFVSLSGDATLSSAGALTIANEAVNYAKFQKLPATSILGRAGNTEGTTSSIPAAQNGQVLRRSGNQLAFGAIDLGVAEAITGTLPATNGGTGIATYAVGDLLVGAASNTLLKIAAVALGNVLISAGTTTSPTWGKVLLGGANNHVSGTLAIANGGTGLTSVTNNAIVYGSSNAWAFTNAMTAGQILLGNANGVPTPTTVTGHVTISNTGETTIADGAVGYAKLANVTALSVVGRSANTDGVAAAINAANDHQVLRRLGTSIGFGAINLASSAAVTGILPAANGGTGSQYFTAAGPSTTRTYTFPNYNANIPAIVTNTIVGAGGATDFDFVHNLNTRAVIVQVYQTANQFAQVYTDVEASGDNKVTIRFAVAPPDGTSYRVVVLGYSNTAPA